MGRRSKRDGLLGAKNSATPPRAPGQESRRELTAKDRQPTCRAAPVSAGLLGRNCPARAPEVTFVQIKQLIRFVLIADLLVLWNSPIASAQTAPNSPSAGESAGESNTPDQKKSLTEVNKELTNPISSIWSITFQENTYWLNMPTGHSDRNQIAATFQPVLPIALTRDWNLISRPVIPIFNSTPYLNNSGNFHRVTGFGDTVFVTMLSPTERLVGRWLLAAGPTFIFPTASNRRLGQNNGNSDPVEYLA